VTDRGDQTSDEVEAALDAAGISDPSIRGWAHDLAQSLDGMGHATLTEADRLTVRVLQASEDPATGPGSRLIEYRQVRGGKSLSVAHVQHHRVYAREKYVEWLLPNPDGSAEAQWVRYSPQYWNLRGGGGSSKKPVSRWWTCSTCGTQNVAALSECEHCGTPR
jgi:hypothetical protein